MATFKVQQGTPVVWKNSGGDYAITLGSLANNAARQGAKGDLGDPNFADEYVAELVIETNTAPTAGNTFELYWAASRNATAGSENPGGASGTDAAYKAAEEDEWKKQLEFIGTLVVTNDASTVQRQIVGKFRPSYRYGMPVVVNKSGQTLNTSNTNHAVTVTPRPVTDA